MRVAVANPTFASDELLRGALREHFPDAQLNTSGRILAGAELGDFLAGATAAIIGLERVDAALLDACPQLRVIAKFGVGLDNIDLAGCAARGIAVHAAPGANALGVAELTLGFMIALARRVAIMNAEVKAGVWLRNGGTQLFGKTVGIIGLGNVGKQSARVLQAVGCTIVAHDILDLRAYAATHEIWWRAPGDLLREADFVSLHVPLTPATRGLIGRTELRAMKPTAFLVNTARGGVVDEDALADALADGTIAGAASDVFAEEPTRNARLLALDNFIATPHIGGNSREAIRSVGMACVRNLVACSAGRT